MMAAEVRKAMAGPGWQRMTPDERKDAVDDIKRDSRRAARSLLFGGGKPVKPMRTQPRPSLPMRS